MYEIFSGFFFAFANKVLLLHHRKDIELWCNGNTTDSGPVILGSNPGSSTEKRGIILAFFILSAGFRCFRFPKQSAGPIPLIDTAAKPDRRFHNARPHPAAVSK